MARKKEKLVKREASLTKAQIESAFVYWCQHRNLSQTARKLGITDRSLRVIKRTNKWDQRLKDEIYPRIEGRSNETAVETINRSIEKIDQFIEKVEQVLLKTHDNGELVYNPTIPELVSLYRLRLEIAAGATTSGQGSNFGQYLALVNINANMTSQEARERIGEIGNRVGDALEDQAFRRDLENRDRSGSS